jgi:acetoin utilization deacetylase AcuC-like enzyme
MYVDLDKLRVKETTTAKAHLADAASVCSLQVFFASLHADPEIEYPYCCGEYAREPISGWLLCDERALMVSFCSSVARSGFADQDGVGAGKGTSINVPLAKNTSWAEYQPQLERCLAAMQTHGVKALVISLGLDTLADDPECAPLAGFRLRNADYVEMGRMIRGLGVPVLFVQEGGYLLPAVGVAVRHVLVGHIQGDKQ